MNRNVDVFLTQARCPSILAGMALLLLAVPLACGRNPTPAAHSASAQPAAAADEASAAPPAPPAPTLKPAEARRRLDAAIVLQKQYKYDEAIRELDALQRAVLQAELAAEAQVELAETHFLKGQDAQEGKLAGVDPEPSLRHAAALFQDALTRHGSVKKFAATAAYMTGSSHLLLGDMTKALAAYQKCYDDFDDTETRAKALIRVGVCQGGLGEPGKAGMSFLKFQREYPQHREGKKVATYIELLKVVGRPAPALHADEWLRGQAPGGLADLRGEVVVLVFFSTGCPHCKDALPELKRRIERWSARGAIFLGIANPDDPESKVPVDVYVQDNDLRYLDVAFDRKERNWWPYRISGLPAAAMVDRKGIVRWRAHLNFFSETLLERLLVETPSG
jgi:TolA-binding protein